MRYLSRQQGKSYGGKYVVWLRKKPRRQRIKKTKVNVSDEPQSCSLRFSFEAESSCSINFPGLAPSSPSLEKEEENKVSPSGAYLIGWDDFLCRPVYQECPSKRHIISTKDQGTSVFSRDDESTKLSGRKREDGAVRMHKNNRSYGSKRRRTTTSTVAGKMNAVFDSEHTEHNYNNNVSSFPSRKRKTRHSISWFSSTKEKSKRRKCDGVEFSSPRQVKACVATVSSTVITTPPQPTEKKCKSICSLSETTMPRNVCNSNVRTRSLRSRLTHGTPSSRKKAKQESVTGKNYHTIVDRDIRQPSSHTSLTRAKKFFERLDATHNLVVYVRDSPVTERPHSNFSVRTTRPTNLNCPKLKQEYTDYCNATRFSGVSPIAISEFASQRGVHFGTNGAFDGMLDSSR